MSECGILCMMCMYDFDNTTLVEWNEDVVRDQGTDFLYLIQVKIQIILFRCSILNKLNPLILLKEKKCYFSL